MNSRHFLCVAQVTADEALEKALFRAPLLVTLMRQAAGKKGAGGTQAPPPVPPGTAEVDLSPLLQPRCTPRSPLLSPLSS